MEDTIITGPYRSLDQLKDGKKVALADKDKKKPESAAKTEDESKTADKDKKENKDKKDPKDEPQTASVSAKP